MENIKERLKADIKIAMKSKDNFKRDVIRFVQSAIKQVEIDTRVDLDDGEVVKILQKLLKQRMDAKEQFAAAGRGDLVEKEEKEALILQSYLPQQLDESELTSIIQDVITKVGASSIKDIGKVMGAAIKACDGRADGSKINTIAKKILEA